MRLLKEDIQKKYIYIKKDKCRCYVRVVVGVDLDGSCRPTTCLEVDNTACIYVYKPEAVGEVLGLGRGKPNKDNCRRPRYSDSCQSARENVALSVRRLTSCYSLSTLHPHHFQQRPLLFLSPPSPPPVKPLFGESTFTYSSSETFFFCFYSSIYFFKNVFP